MKRLLYVVLFLAFAAPALAVDCYAQYDACESKCGSGSMAPATYQACMDRCEATEDACLDAQGGGWGDSCPVYICPYWG